MVGALPRRRGTGQGDGAVSAGAEIPGHRDDPSEGHPERLRRAGEPVDHDRGLGGDPPSDPPDQPEQPLDLILHTPGGLVLAAEQIAKALVEHKGKVTVFMPHYALSGGTLIALTADEVVMDPNAVIGPVDPQVGGLPAASILEPLELEKPAQG